MSDGTLLHRIWPDKQRPGRTPAFLLLLATVMVFGLTVCGFGGWSALLRIPEKPLRAAREEMPVSPVLRQTDDGPKVLEQTVIPVFAAFFDSGRDAAQAYCDGMPETTGASGIAGHARIWIGGTQLSVPEVLQLPQLPNGCEVTSLTALLQYRGLPANKLDLAYGYVPREDFTQSRYGSIGPDPELAYAGDPAADSGFYCFAAPLAQGANQYLLEMGSSMHAFDVTGVTAEGLEQYIRGGDPVVVWVTLDLSRPRTGNAAWIVGDTVYKPYVNLHCVVLIGWGPNICTLMDPLVGIRTVDQQTFLRCFKQMGSRALVIH